MKTVSDVLKMIKDKDVKFVDLRFTDTKGKMQHVTADVSTVDEAMFEGYAFDGSSIAGWKGIESSDMYLKMGPRPPGPRRSLRFAQITVAIFCDVIEPLTGQPSEGDPRSIAKEGRSLHGLARYRRPGQVFLAAAPRAEGSSSSTAIGISRQHVREVQKGTEISTRLPTWRGLPPHGMPQKLPRHPPPAPPP